MTSKKLTCILCMHMSIIFCQLTNYNLELVHHVQEINEFNSNSNYGVSDVWGYTDETGTEYAVVGYRYGTFIYDVTTNPDNPILISDIIGPASGDYYFHRDYKTHQNHLYIVNEMYGGDIGMQVVDLSPLPDDPPIQLTTYNEMGQSHNLWIDTDSGLAFIEHQTGDNIHIANLSNPSSPSYEGSFENLANNCHDIFTRNNYAYISEGWDYRFGIYDISDLNNIIELASIPSVGYAHNAWLNDNSTLLITTEETENQTVKIWDISDLNNISLSGEYLGENNLAHNVHVKNNLLYISHYSTGLKIVDLFNPERPIEIAAYDTYPINDDGGYIGCWGAYPFTNNNYIYASDMQYGLYILNFNGSLAGFINGYLFTNDNIPLTNTAIKSLLNNKTYYSDNSGNFDFGHPAGEYNFLINNADTLLMTIHAHEITTENYYIEQNYLAGDVNQDQILDVLDIILIINFIMSTSEPTGQQGWLSDINQDNNINIQDIIMLVQLILN